MHEDPDRLRQPLRRTPSGFKEIGWREAFDLAADGLARVRREHGRDAVAVYLGNPITHNLGAMVSLVPLLAALRTRSRFSATSVDQLPRMLVSLLLYGHQLLIPIPDIDNTDFFLIIGANPVASNGSIMTAPGIPRRIRAIQERGGRVVVVDPRRTETAASLRASLHPSGHRCAPSAAPGGDRTPEGERERPDGRSARGRARRDSELFRRSGQR